MITRAKRVFILSVLLSARMLLGQTLVNGGFEEAEGGAVRGWHTCGSYAVDTATAKSGAQAIRCETSDGKGASGAMQEIVYAKPDRAPVLFGGWSLAERVLAQDYCVYLDIWYEGGGNAWGVTANWSQQAHDWEYAAEVFYPAKPIQKIQCFVFLRRGAGRVWFDDLFLERRAPALGVKALRFVSDFPRTQAGVHASLDLWKAAAWKCRFTDAVGRELETYSGSGDRAFIASEGVGTPASFRVSAAAGKETFEQTFALPVLPRVRNPVRRGCAVWTADSMRRVTPLTYPSDAEMEPEGIALDLARNEWESAQILVTASDAGPVKGVTVELTPFQSAGRLAFDGEVAWEREGYILRERPFHPHPCGVPAEEGWIPDPLLPPRPFDVRAGATQGVWLTVRAGDGAKPGLYSGLAILSAEGKTLRKLPVSLRVRNVRNPRTFGMPTAFCVMDGFTKAQYPGRFEEMKRKTHDLMLSYRLNPDDISRTEPPRIEDLLHAREKGMNRFNLLNLVPKPEKPVKWVCYSPPEVYTPAFYEELKARLTPYVAELRKHGLEKYAYLYGFDERTHDFYPIIDALWRKLRTDFPDIPVMTTAMMFRDMRDGDSYPCQDTTDWFCPLTSVYDPALAAQLRARGRQVWWYVCCGPTYPYANFASVEYPLIEGRLLGWMTYRYHSDGLLFWHVNLWPDAPPLKTGDTFLGAWRAENSNRMPGDGQLLYPGEDGPMPSIRLANVRDGVEDYEWLALLERKTGRAAAEALASELVRGMTEFERSPEALRKTRARLAERLEQFKD